MDTERAAEELKVIRQLMERPIRYSTMSGLSAILAGCAVLAGLAIHSKIFQSNEPHMAVWINACVWAGVFTVALAGVLGLTRIRERRLGMPFWSGVKKRILLTVLPSFVAGVGLTMAIVYRRYIGDGPDEWGLIPAVWMLFYGVALWQVGDLSIVEVRVMGVAFIVAGLICGALSQFSSYWTLGITFGGFHIVYGVIVRVRHGG